MKNKSCKPHSSVFKILSVMAVTFLCINILSGIVRADTGPKRSIDIDLKNMPSEPYYIAILEPYEGDPNLERYYRGDKIPEEDEWAREIFLNYHEDGYRLFCYAGGYSSVKTSESDIKDSDNISYGYMVPSTFKVIVVTHSGEVTVSNEIKVKAFHSTCVYDYSANEVEETGLIAGFARNLTIESILFFGVTLFIEGIVLLCFGLFRKKNLLRFLIANASTQLLLYVFNLTCRLIEPLWQKYYIAWLVAEAVIMMIEVLIYCKKLVRKDGSVSVKRNIAYAVTANVISAFIDIPVILLAMLML